MFLLDAADDSTSHDTEAPKAVAQTIDIDYCEEVAEVQEPQSYAYCTSTHCRATHTRLRLQIRQLQRKVNCCLSLCEHTHTTTMCIVNGSRLIVPIFAKNSR